MVSGALHPSSNLREEHMKTVVAGSNPARGKDDVASGFCAMYAARYVSKAQLKLIFDDRYWFVFGFCDAYASRYVSKYN